MANIYDKRRYWKWAFLTISILLVGFFLYISNNLVKNLAKQERERMEIWANATKALATTPDLNSEGYPMQSVDIDFLLDIIQHNDNIPVLLVDENDNILMHRNFTLPEPIDSLMPTVLSPANRQYLADKLVQLKNTTNHIPIQIDQHTTQHLYYEDSTLLTSMSFFPRIQLGVMILGHEHQKGRTEQGVGRTLKGNRPPARHTHLVAHGMGADAGGDWR